MSLLPVARVQREATAHGAVGFLRALYEGAELPDHHRDAAGELLSKYDTADAAMKAEATNA